MSARRNIIPIFIPHLGCPNDCVFCNQKRISGSLFPAVPETVRQELESGISRCGDGTEIEAAFYGGSFTAIPADEQTALLSAAEPFLKSGRIRALRLSTRPDAIDAQTLERLRRFGVETIELGAQSMDERVLEMSGRGHTAEDTVRAAEMIKAAGFRLVLQMMTGLPGADRESDLRSAEKIAALMPDGVRIYPTVVIKDTALCDMWRSGEYAEHTVEDAVDLCAEIVPMFEERGIGIIRLGLNPTEELSGGAAVAGAYHPAMGELVRSRILRKRAEALLDDCSGEEVILGVHPSRVSAMTGQHRCNIDYLCGRFELSGLKVRAEELDVDEIRVYYIAKNDIIRYNK